MKPGEIYLANFPFGDAAGMKLRPVLLITGPIGIGPEVLVAYISSVIPTTTLATDVEIDPNHPDFQSTHLRARSVLRLHKLATIHAMSLARRLGKLSAQSEMDVRTRLKSMLRL
jgi:mRNA interferase MazF